MQTVPWDKSLTKYLSQLLFRHPGDKKPCLDIPVLGHDFTLIDNKESKKNYAFKMSRPDMDSFFFATDSRQAVGKWIEVLSLSATGGQDILAPYPPYFSSASELNTQSLESPVSSEVNQTNVLIGSESGDLNW